MEYHVELEREIERLAEELYRVKTRMKEIVQKRDNTDEELMELAGLLSREKELQRKLNDALNAKFFRGGR